MYSFDRRVVFILVTTATVRPTPAAVDCCVVGANGPPLVLKNAQIWLLFTRFTLQSSSSGRSSGMEALLAGDELLLGFTLYRGYTHRRGIVGTGSLRRVLVRDAMYLVIIFVANLANIFMFFSCDFPFHSFLDFANHRHQNLVRRHRHGRLPFSRDDVAVRNNDLPTNAQSSRSGLNNPGYLTASKTVFGSLRLKMDLISDMQGFCTCTWSYLCEYK
ncbi:hypothetical protein B0H14DRAFT_3884927 [Mycena olivaceomarginata]|nr:hypothetical protein B0H14DRAFT_3884927 [Mycena olivaceomarginata]